MNQGGDEANRVPTRGDIHVMLVGDPGLGKSQLLQVQCGRRGGGVRRCCGGDYLSPPPGCCSR